MRQARAFFFVCLGILALVLAYHFGASTATAQAPGNPVVVVEGIHAYTANGDQWEYSGSGWHWVANIFGSATPAQSISIGQLKAKYATPAAGK